MRPRPYPSRCAALLLFLSQAVSLGLFAESSPGGTASPGGSLVPREIFIGDEGALSFPSPLFSRLLAPGERASLTAAELPESGEDAAILGVEISRGPAETESATVTIRFVPWKVGPLSLPDVRWKGLTASPPAVSVSSLADRLGEVSLRGPRSPLLIPGTSWLLYLSLALAVLVLAGGTLALRRIISELSGRSATRATARRQRLLRKDLSRLEKKIKKTPPSLWYAELSHVIRKYLSLFAPDAGVLFSACTPREAARALESFRGGLDTSVLIGVLEGIDRNRYGGPSEAETRPADLSLLRELSVSLERAASEEIP